MQAVDRYSVPWSKPSAPASKVSSKSLKSPIKSFHSPQVLYVLYSEGVCVHNSVTNNYKCDLAKYSQHLNWYKSSKLDTA